MQRIFLGFGMALALMVPACGGGGQSASSPTGGGGNSSGGSASTGGTNAGGSAGMDVAPMHVVTACDKLLGVGVWEHITPPNVDLSTFGVVGVTFDPNDSSNVFVSTAKSGLHKSTDCGATWTKIDTGAGSADIDKGAVGVILDPLNPKVLYTGSLYGTNGFFKSTDGGVSWTQKLTPDIQKVAPYGGFIGGMDMDPGPAPNANRHLLVAWHQECAAPFNKACYAETTDGGESWTMRNGDPTWAGGEGTSLQFLDSTRWLFSSSSNGLWITKDSGKTWNKVPSGMISHGSGELFRTKGGSFFLGSATGVLYSQTGDDWALVPNSGTLIAGVTGNGTHVWTSSAFPYNPDARTAPSVRYRVADESDPMTWSNFDSAAMTSGGTALAYDPDHKLLYSANYWDGLWRVVVE